MGTVSIGSDTFDIYGTEAGAKSYLAGRLGVSAWTDADSNDKRRALVEATRWLDRANWQGLKTDLVTPQALEFPRTGLTDKDGQSVDSATVPLDVEYACYELAVVLLDDAAKPDSPDGGSNVKRAKAGPAEVEFFVGTQGDFPRFPTRAHELIRSFLEGASTLAAPWASDTSGETAFDDDDLLDLNEGVA